jgi:hypothetical protein
MLGTRDVGFDIISKQSNFVRRQTQMVHRGMEEGLGGFAYR